MKRYLAAIIVFSFITSLICAQQTVPLYEGAAPGSENWDWLEQEITRPGGGNISYNVSKPVLEIYRPEAGKENGTAVVIAPGGGFHFLSINSEGREVAHWLAAKGVTSFVLRYRLVHVTSGDPSGELGKKLGTKKFQEDTDKIIPLSIADGRRAIAWVRRHAAGLGIDPNRIGVMGFSAGGTVTAATLFNYSEDNKPNFAAPVYPFFPGNMMGEVNASTPPLFITVASDDNLGLASHSIDLYNKWLNAKLPVELHAYAKGGHGFGMRKQNLPSDTWIERFAEWLDVQGLMTKPNADTTFKDYQKKEFVFENNKVLPYRILYPKNYDRSKKYPLIVFLHGSGERGNNNEAQLVHGGKLFLKENIRAQYPAIVVFPQCPEGASWNSMSVDRTKNPPVRAIDYSVAEPWPLAATHKLIRSLLNSESVDQDRVYLSGLSLGGFGTFEMIYRHPETFAAALPICGGGDVNAYDKRVAKIPFWVFHGDADQAVDVKLSRDMVEKLKKIGAKVKYTEYPGVGHNSWDNAFAEPNYIGWMFEQKKK